MNSSKEKKREEVKENIENIRLTTDKQMPAEMQSGAPTIEMPENRKSSENGVVTNSHHDKKFICSHMRFRQIEKTKRPGIVNILVVCRSCRRAGEEIIEVKQNGKSVYSARTFHWLQ